jgi:hypothetical protein
LKHHCLSIPPMSIITAHCYGKMINFWVWGSSCMGSFSNEVTYSICVEQRFSNHFFIVFGSDLGKSQDQPSSLKNLSLKTIWGCPDHPGYPLVRMMSRLYLVPDFLWHTSAVMSNLCAAAHLYAPKIFGNVMKRILGMVLVLAYFQGVPGLKKGWTPLQ